MAKYFVVTATDRSTRTKLSRREVKKTFTPTQSPSAAAGPPPPHSRGPIDALHQRTSFGCIPRMSDSKPSRKGPPVNPYVRDLVADKLHYSSPAKPEDAEKGFAGWNERGYLPHRDEPGLIQFVTFRLEDSLPRSLRSEWEHLWTIEDDRERRTELERYLDKGRGECHLRNREVAEVVERALLFFHRERYDLRAWCTCRITCTCFSKSKAFRCRRSSKAGRNTRQLSRTSSSTGAAPFGRLIILILTCATERMRKEPSATSKTTRPKRNSFSIRKSGNGAAPVFATITATSLCNGPRLCGVKGTSSRD